MSTGEKFLTRKWTKLSQNWYSVESPRASTGAQSFRFVVHTTLGLEAHHPGLEASSSFQERKDCLPLGRSFLSSKAGSVLGLSLLWEREDAAASAAYGNDRISPELALSGVPFWESSSLNLWSPSNPLRAGVKQRTDTARTEGSCA